MKQMRSLFWFLVSTVVLCASLGGIYGRRLEAAISNDTGQDGGVLQSIDSFSKVYDLVQKRYADAPDPDRAIFGPEGSSTLTGSLVITFG